MGILDILKESDPSRDDVSKPKTMKFSVAVDALLDSWSSPAYCVIGENENDLFGMYSKRQHGKNGSALLRLENEALDHILELRRIVRERDKLV